MQNKHFSYNFAYIRDEIVLKKLAVFHAHFQTDCLYPAYAQG